MSRTNRNQKEDSSPLIVNEIHNLIERKIARFESANPTEKGEIYAAVQSLQAVILNTMYSNMEGQN